jgi:ABC-2 type transport system permease protein
VIILLVSLTLGVRIHTGAAGWLVIIATAVLVNAVFAGMSQAIALLTRREATMIAVANFIGLPLLFLSTTMIALSQMPGWMQTASKFNPVDWGVRAAREVVLPGTSWGSVGGHLLLLLALAALTAGWAAQTFRIYQRSL